MVSKASQAKGMEQTTIGGLASGGMAMGGGFLTAIMSPGEDAANAGLFVGMAGVVGTLLTSITPWVRAWFDDRKEERAFRAQRLKEQLDDAVKRLSLVENKEVQIDVTAAHVAGLDGKLAGAMKTLQDSGVLLGDRPAPPSAPTWPRLLLVEDDPETARAMSQLLTHLGFDVNHAATVEEANHILMTRPNWVILDLALGHGGDGIDVLRTIREGGLPSKVVVTTGTIDPERLRAVEELRPEVVLRKPISFDDLTRRIRPR